MWYKVGNKELIYLFVLVLFQYKVWLSYYTLKGIAKQKGNKLFALSLDWYL